MDGASNYLLAFRSPTAQRLLAVLSGVLITVSLFLVFIVAPNEAVMGAVQRIFYFHVAAAISSYLLMLVLLFASSMYLMSRDADLDALAESAAGVALMLCTVVLFSGMIWGHSAWNTWWRWEPRLVSFLVLWLILIAYQILRWFSEGNERERSYAAVVGIVAAVNVPIVIFSIKILSAREQLHPQVVARGGLSELPNAGLILGISSVAMAAFSIWLTSLLFHQRNLELRVREIELNRTGDL